MPGDQTYHGAAFAGLDSDDVPPALSGRRARHEPEPGSGLLGAAYDGPSWRDAAAPSARPDPVPPSHARPQSHAGSSPGDPEAVRLRHEPHHQPPVLRGALLPDSQPREQAWPEAAVAPSAPESATPAESGWPGQAGPEQAGPARSQHGLQHRAASQHQPASHHQQSDWWTAPDPWAPADPHAADATPRAGRGHYEPPAAQGPPADPGGR